MAAILFRVRWVNYYNFCRFRNGCWNYWNNGISFDFDVYVDLDHLDTLYRSFEWRVGKWHMISCFLSSRRHATQLHAVAAGYQLWTNCFMWWSVVSYPGPLNPTDTTHSGRQHGNGPSVRILDKTGYNKCAVCKDYPTKDAFIVLEFKFVRATCIYDDHMLYLNLQTYLPLFRDQKYRP